MKNKIIANSLCFALASKIYGLICVYVGHSVIYKGFCSFTHRIHTYSQHSKILKYLNKGSEYRKISLYKICINKIEKFIANLVQTINDIYMKSSAGSLLFGFLRRERKNMKENPYAYVLLMFLGGAVSLSILNLFFNKFHLRQLVISALFIVVIIIFYLNSSNIIKNSSLVNVFVRFFDSGIEE